MIKGISLVLYLVRFSSFSGWVFNFDFDGYLDFLSEFLDEILIDDSITRREERQNVGDKIPLIILKKGKKNIYCTA